MSGAKNKIVSVDAAKENTILGQYKSWFLEYASYVILERAVPAIEDGLKPVQRRILHAMKEMDDGRFNKVANIIGQAMQYHPHGDASIGDALVNLGQKDLLIDTQGNWGDVRTGDDAAASRYITLLANGSITAPMHDAGVIFRTQFRAAALNGMRVMPLLRVSGGKGATLTEYTIAARDKVSDVLGLFGGTDSACGSCLWHVLGLECSLREWATRQGWGGRSVNHVQAQGILVAALNVLAVHYGLAAGRRAA
jgi:hypothetical protein